MYLVFLFALFFLIYELHCVYVHGMFISTYVHCEQYVPSWKLTTLSFLISYTYRTDGPRRGDRIRDLDLQYKDERTKYC